MKNKDINWRPIEENGPLLLTENYFKMVIFKTDSGAYRISQADMYESFNDELLGYDERVLEYAFLEEYSA